MLQTHHIRHDKEACNQFFVAFIAVESYLHSQRPELLAAQQQAVGKFAVGFSLVCLCTW